MSSATVPASIPAASVGPCLAVAKPAPLSRRCKIVAACARVTGCFGLKLSVAPEDTMPRCAMYCTSAKYSLEILASSLKATFSVFTAGEMLSFFAKLAADATNSSRFIVFVGLNAVLDVPSITPAALTNLIAELDQRSAATSEYAAASSFAVRAVKS